MSNTSYDEIIKELASRIIKIKHLRFILSDIEQLKNIYKFKRSSIYGEGELLNIQLGNYVDSGNPDNLIVDVPFHDNPLIIQADNFFDYSVNPNTEVIIMVYHEPNAYISAYNEVFDGTGKKKLPNIAELISGLINITSEPLKKKLCLRKNCWQSMKKRIKKFRH